MKINVSFPAPNILRRDVAHHFAPSMGEKVCVFVVGTTPNTNAGQSLEPADYGVFIPKILGVKYSNDMESVSKKVMDTLRGSPQHNETTHVLLFDYKSDKEA